MFERFTDRARRVLVLAQEEAKAMRHNFIGTEHVLLGLISEGEGVAAKALVQLGFDLDETRTRVAELIGPSTDDAGEVLEKPPFTPRSKKVLELALREALTLDHNYIGTEHLLLGVVKEGEGVAAQLLTAKGAEPTAVRAAVLRLLAKHGLPKGISKTHTPAGAAVNFAVAAAAGSNPIGSHHYLLVLASDASSLAGKILAGHGVTAQVVREQIDALGTDGTSDAAPPRFEATTTDGTVVIRITDPDLAEKVRTGALAVSFTAPAPDEPPAT